MSWSLVILIPVAHQGLIHSAFDVKSFSAKKQLSRFAFSCFRERFLNHVFRGMFNIQYTVRQMHLLLIIHNKRFELIELNVEL